uniref:PDZ domain-containing protein n=1 Tax=Panagrolaimus sp. PS1159 TaxID=55785 RepID=A0AC35FWU6_9BILA
MRLFKGRSRRESSTTSETAVTSTTSTATATTSITTAKSSSKFITSSTTTTLSTTKTMEMNNKNAAVSSFLSKHYDAIYISTEDEDSGPYAPSTMTTTTVKNTLTTNVQETAKIITAPIYTQYPQSALSARIRQFTGGQNPPGSTKRDSGDSELSVRFADQLVTSSASLHSKKRKHRVEFKTTTSEGGDFFDGKSSVAKSTVSCPPIPNTNSFDYNSFVEYIIKLTGDWTQVQVVHLPNDQTVGLGFGIVGGPSTGVVVKTILPGSAADKDGRLRPGDRILQIGRINVQGMSSQQVAGLLRQPEEIIEVIVGRPINVTDTAEDSLCKCFI